VKDEPKTTAAGRFCHCRADRRWRFLQSCRKRQHRVEGVVVGAGDAALEGVVAVDRVVVGAGDAALEGVVAVDRVVVGAGDAAAEGVLAVKGSRRRLPPLVALGLAGLIGVIGAGCGSSTPSEPGTASSSDAASTGTASNTSSGATTKLTAQEKAVKFAECMRANGVPHFPDPDSKGNFNFGVDVSKEVFTKAVDACKALEPPGALSAKRTSKQQSAALRFAQCVRDHGVKDFPDPVNGEPLIDTTKIPSSNKPGGMTILNAATHKCGGILNLAAGGQG
jgi:hypothetical protein